MKGADHYLNPHSLPKLPSWYEPAKVTFREGPHEFLKL